MSVKQKLLNGISIISEVYNNKLNDKDFNRDEIVNVVSILSNLGFKHVRNEDQLAILQCNIYGVIKVVKIGKVGDKSFFSMAD